MSAHVGHAPEYGGSVATRRVATGGGEVGKVRGEARHWPGKPERNRSSLESLWECVFKEIIFVFKLNCNFKMFGIVI